MKRFCCFPLSVGEKSDRLLKAQKHLESARAESKHYNECKDCEEKWKSSETSEDYRGPMHYSFDFAQQLHYPSHALQPGPIFFKTARRCQVFGVCCEPNQFHNEEELPLQDDNCVGQNKNNAAIQYLLWHTMIGRNKSASLSFMIAGHAKFAPDWFLGLFKRKYHHSDINSLVDICVSVTSSSITRQNKIQLIADAMGNS